MTKYGHLNVQRAYKRRNTGAGAFHFCHFLRSPDKNALTKWRPTQRTARYRLFSYSLRKYMSVSHGQKKHKLTETLPCLMYAFMSEKKRAALLAYCRVRARGQAIKCRRLSRRNWWAVPHVNPVATKSEC